MCKRKGEPLGGVEFFNQLYADNLFCLYLGKVMLSASRLESELIKYISNKRPDEKTHRASLGTLIGIIENNSLLKQMLPALRDIKGQRNYLAHNLHSLFVGLIDESVLPRTDLLDSDIDIFAARATQLDENLISIADIISKYNENNELVSPADVKKRHV